jgi:GPN-loop GTPase
MVLSSRTVVGARRLKFGKLRSGLIYFWSNIEMRYAILVTGPAGSGKSTFCSSLLTHLQASRRTGHLMNLDPAAESFQYEPSVDIKNLISLEDVMGELGYGPNGGLVYCFE